jgi:exopolysaccharide production protein ExoZ
VTLAQARALPKGRVTSALCLLGDASYSLYLLHTLVFCAVRMFVPRLFSPVEHQWVYATILVCAAIGVAIVVYLHFERPLTKMLQRRISTVAVKMKERPA